MERNCLECEDVVKGRADKKFCSDQCRNGYNNKLNTNANNYMRNVNHTLRKNRRILEELNSTGKSKVKKDKLIVKGFNFTYFTSTYATRKGDVYCYCYEQGYPPLENDYYMLVVKQDYVE
jgi:hypothetical protein